MSTVIVTQEETGTAVFACKFMRQRRRAHLRVKLELSPHPALQEAAKAAKRTARPGPGGVSHFFDWKRRRASG
jgi:hypothetical protein